MGTTRTSIAWLIASLTVGLVSGLPHVTLASDAGPGKEVRAIRHDLPLIVRARFLSPATPPIAVDAVAVEGGSALAQWHDAKGAHIAALARRYGRWWLSNDYALDDSCPTFPTRAFFISQGLSQTLVDNAAAVLPAMAIADSVPLATPAPDGRLTKSIGFCDRYWVERLDFSRSSQLLIPRVPMDGYGLRVSFAQNDATPDASIRGVTYRAPTEAESWVADGGNSYFFFSGNVVSPAAIRIGAGTTIAVWFPFVLDPSLHYALTLAHADKPIGPIDGTLTNNVVRFVLPAMTLSPGAQLDGEIEGDAWPHYDGS